MSNLSPLFDWRAAVASKHGPTKPVTRHVLLTLSLWMSAKGDSCYPSQETVAEASKLTVKTVRTHLQLAEDEGWLTRDAHGFGGQGWRRYEYGARVPSRVMNAIRDEHRRAVSDTAPPEEGPVRDSPPRSEGGVNDDSDVGYQLPMSASVEDVNNDGPVFSQLVYTVAQFCRRCDLDKWPLKSTTIDEWCAGVEREIEYAGLNLQAETVKCGDYWEAKKSKAKKAAPHMRLRNWWGLAAKRAAETNGSASAPMDDVSRLHDMIGES